MGATGTSALAAADASDWAMNMVESVAASGSVLSSFAKDIDDNNRDEGDARVGSACETKAVVEVDKEPVDIDKVGANWSPASASNVSNADRVARNGGAMRFDDSALAAPADAHES